MRGLDFKRPMNLDEAYELLNSNEKSVLIAGGLFLRLQKTSYSVIIDLETLNLNYIKEEGNFFRIGSMTSLREIEKSNLPKGIIESVMQISGVGVRNIATVGGSICGRYPFSDINIALMAHDARLVFHKSGEMPIVDFIHNGITEKDILVEVKFKKSSFSATKYYKKVYNDFSLVNASMADNRLVIGARPGRGVIVEDISELSDVVFKTDIRASAEYRRDLAKYLVEEIMKEKMAYGS
jgi:CO/xanthine dehydrogenase FAD-binding subunit